MPLALLLTAAACSAAENPKARLQAGGQAEELSGIAHS